MNWWEKSIRDTEEVLKTKRNHGLSKEEVKKRQQEYGNNRIDHENQQKSLLSRFFAQLNDFMVIILIAAAVASFGVSFWHGETDFIDSAIILIIVALNAVLGMVQESKAQKAIDALKKMAAPKAHVLRDGMRQEVKAEEVVPGDILLLEAGDYVCADARLVESISLKAEESAITGESVPSEKEADCVFSKNTALGDRKNMVFSSSYITYGKGKAIVTNTGMSTEVGRIAQLISNEGEGETPLQKRLDKTGKTLGIGAIIICIIIFIMGLFRNAEPLEMFMTSVSLAVAAIPEGLPAIVTIVLAIGMQRMSKKNTIIRRLPAVETLGSANVICSDKTGTLTQNKMKVVKVTDCEGKLEHNLEKRKLILLLGALCNDSHKDNKKILGEPTEVALLEAAEEGGENIETLSERMPRIGELPFSSERKLMTTVHKVSGKGWISVTKGAPDVLLERCVQYVGGKGQMPFSRSKKEQAVQLNSKMAGNALRVIAVAFREFDTKPTMISENYLEHNLTFAGMLGMIDPPRPEAKKAVETCKKAGIRAVMITGDHYLTAKATAEQLGIFQRNDRVMTGEELEKTSVEELSDKIEEYSVFARVSPDHKVRIVKAYQEKGAVVAMTGDGVNDAPALKVADIGCAMGKNGTEVAKGASDMILTDDNFATIVEAVREGRGIYDNIKKAVHFLLSSNIGEIITIFAAMCFGWATPLLPIQLLWVNLVTDSLPAIALGLDPAEKDIMERKPQKGEKSLFSGGMGERIALEGCMIGMLALIAFAIGHIYFDLEKGHVIGRTMAFAVLSISQLVHAFNMRTEHSIFSISLFSNLYLVGAFIIGLCLQVGVIMLPQICRIFQVCPLNTFQWGIVAGLTIVPIFVVELEKWKDRILAKEKRKHQLQKVEIS